MQINFYLSIFFVFLLLLTRPVSAGNAVQGIPNLFYDNPSLTLPHSVLGRSCYSLPASYLDLDCNPAFLAGERKHIFRVNLVGNDRLDVLNRYRLQIKDNDVVGLAERMLNQRTQLVGRAAGSLWYQHEWWAVGLVPFRGGVAFLSRNPAYPEFSALAFKESEFFGKFGLFTSENGHFRVGLQARFLERSFVYQQVYAVELADPEVVQIHDQQVIFLEPGFAYSWDGDVPSTLAWSLTHLPVYQHGARLPTQPVMDVGWSSHFPGFSRHFYSTFHYTDRPDQPEVLRRFSWSGVYDFDRQVASAMVTVGVDQFGLGLDGHLDIFVLGVAYKTEQMAVDPWTQHHVSSFTFELGLNF